MMSKVNRPPLSLSRIVLNMKGRENLTAVVVGKVVNDPRLLMVSFAVASSVRGQGAKG